MVSKRPSFRAEMLEALSFGAPSVALRFEAKVRSNILKFGDRE
jgi:hypothetical protein